MRPLTLPLAFLPFPLVGLMLSGCGGSDDTSPPEPLATGTVSIALSDSPMSQVSRVELVLDKLVMTDAHGQRHTQDMAQHRFNLLDYQGMDSHRVIDGLELPAGQYHDVHFTLVNGDQAQGCLIENGQGQHPLMIEDGRLPMANFTLGEHQHLNLTMEIDLYQSMHLSDGQYQLNHHGIYSIDDDTMGHIFGEMDPQWIADCETQYAASAPEGGQFYHMAYLYPSEVTSLAQMGDIAQSRDDGLFSPVAISPIRQDINGNWFFAMGYLPAGNYRVGYTCLGHLDSPPQNDMTQGAFKLFEDGGEIGVEDGGRETRHQCGGGHGGHRG
ncbi:DUF4382 domain-containing protein [Shewanella halotolerans]|uniref:DUF4382 domain-containing protein n=1 Tax=Shewanella halotolerans TaxID=2864204 RepID=UPI001C65DA0F|nr:DUF4382 domain-containing protein [Shewanella halotolerans]QYJ90798.1 DUF4382 domain-containing protein [Shewanella halotolerans]